MKSHALRASLAIALTAPALLIAGPAHAAPSNGFTIVEHGLTETVHWSGDICGDRANTTTYTGTVEQVHLTQPTPDSFTYHDVAVVTYVSDYDDPALPTLTGRLTEVNRFTFTRGGTFTGTTTYHDFVGGIRIFERVHITEVNGVITVDRTLQKVTGCP